ncbi:MAG: hypothetical protein GY812_11295 [Actinomycetia bacterium]|nr:hypothetical protein [Actinomycetes bacterium]
MTTTRNRVLVLSIGLVLVAAGCSSTDDEAADTTSTEAPTTTARATTAAPTTSAAASAPCTEEAIALALPQGDTINDFRCDSGYAVAGVTNTSDPDPESQYDYTARLKSSQGLWVEDDDCTTFPASLQDECNTN